MNWKEFLTILEKGGVLKSNDDFTFEGDFSDITPYGKTVSIEGFYHSPDNFYFNLIGENDNMQVQITSNQNYNKFINERLMMKIVFSKKTIE